MEPGKEKSMLRRSLLKDMGLKSKKSVLQTRFNLKTARGYLGEKRGNVHQFKKSGRRHGGLERQLGLNHPMACCTRGLRNKKVKNAEVSSTMAPQNTTQYIMDRVYEDMCEDWLTQDNASSQLPLTERCFRLQDGTQVPFPATVPQQSTFERTLEFLQADFDNVVFWNEI